MGGGRVTAATEARLAQIVKLSWQHDSHVCSRIRELAERALADERAVGDPIETFHCVIQLQEDSWEYRLKRPGDEDSEDDLVSWTDYLAMHDRLVLERDALDKRRVGEIEELRRDLYDARKRADDNPSEG